MKTPQNSLQAVLERQAHAAPPPQAASDPPGRKFHRPSREATRLIAGHFDARVAKQLRLLAAEEDTTIRDLLGEALDLLFVKKGKGKIVQI